MLRRRVYENADTSAVRDVAIANSATIANVTNTPPFCSSRRSWPTKSQSDKIVELQKLFFARISKLLRPFVKISRLGVLARVSYSLNLSYVDLVTDVLVCKDYWDNERKQLAYTSGGCIALALVLQAAINFQQYKVKEVGWAVALWIVSGVEAFSPIPRCPLVLQSKSGLERGLRTGLAYFICSPLLEGFNTWTSTETADLVISPSAMYTFTKAIEIAFKSIPESIVQISGLFGASKGQIKSFHVFFVVSSILAAAFIMMRPDAGSPRGECLVSGL